MKQLIVIVIGLIGLLFFVQQVKAGDMYCVKWNPGHYVLLINKYRKKDPENFIASLDKNFKGVQMRVYWRDLEVEKNHYNFNKIERIVAILKKYDKRLFLQIDERMFHSDERPLPDYLYKEPEYEGGAEPFGRDKKKGSVAKIWIPTVLNRFNNLIEALGNRFDREPAFEGINFPETSIAIHRWKAKNFSKTKYLNALKLRLQAAKQAFPHSVVIQYVNFLGKNKEELEGFIRYCYETGVGIGGPDLVPDIGRHKNQKRIPAYSYYPFYAGKMPLGVAVQQPELTRKWGIFTLDAFWDMGINTLKLNYIFWLSMDWRKLTHSFSRDITPYIKKKEGKINSQCPENLALCCSGLLTPRDLRIESVGER